MDDRIFSYKDIVGPSYAGFDVYESIQMTDEMEDWSKVRSPARARRRRKHGHRQNILIYHVPSAKIYQIGNALHMHPETAEKLRQRISAEIDKSMMKVMGVKDGQISRW
jgi:hypothetical protein